jgi:hypothetical protein
LKTYGGNSETCQDDNISVLFTNIVFISCTKMILIYAIVQMTIIDLVALGYILWHSAAFQSIRLYYKTLGSMPRGSTSTQID